MDTDTDLDLTMGVVTISEELARMVAELNLEEKFAVVELLRVLIANRKGKKHSITELKGLGKEIWEGIDAQEYVDELRGKREPDDTLCKKCLAAPDYANEPRLIPGSIAALRADFVPVTAHPFYPADSRPRNRHSRASGNPERYSQRPAYCHPGFSGFPLARE